MASQPAKSDPLPTDVRDHSDEPISAIVRQFTQEELDFEAIRGKVDDNVALRLMNGYRLSLRTLLKFHLDEWAPNEDELSGYVPTFGQAISRFTDEDLSLLSEYQKPTILISPPHKTFRDLMGALAYHHEPGTKMGPVVGELNTIDWGSDNEFRPYIAEAISNVTPKHDITSQPLGGRMGRRYELRKHAECGMDNRLYTLLAMQSIVRGQMIDQKTFTILDGEPIVAARYAAKGECKDGQPSVEWISLEDPVSVRGRFRRVLRGNRS
jgi:hypothetical protein